jgi:hypothetical protein
MYNFDIIKNTLPIEWHHSGMYYLRPYEYGFTFIKPLASKMHEINFLKGRTTSDCFYYPTLVHNINRLKSGASNSIKPFYTKNEVDKFPKYLRRGGIYGHDKVVVLPKDQRPDYCHQERIEHIISLCKIHKLI